MAKARKRGRRKGWRKPDAKRQHLMIRLTVVEARAIAAAARRFRLSRAELVRRCILHVKVSGVLENLGRRA